MDEIVYNGITQYYQALSRLGYYNYKNVFSLLLLSFYRDFVFEDYRGILSREDYFEIERALNCLFGKNCLIPYPDYLKMGKLHIGEMTEMAHRVKTLEDEPVMKLIHDLNSVDNADEQSDIKIVLSEEE